MNTRDPRAIRSFFATLRESLPKDPSIDAEYWRRYNALIERFEMSLPLSISEFRLQENDVPHSLERGRLVNKIDALIRFLGLLSEQMEVLGKGKRSILSARETSHA